MAIIKCKMCGGDLKITEGTTVSECEYCGSRQTVPTADNEKKMTLFTRANRLLRNCEFDKASGVFEAIVADFPEEAEAYWGLVLCKYGIEYVDDPATGKKIPTCHRSSFDSVLDDTNYEQACENTDAVARRVYRDEARQIEELRKSIIEVSGKEEPYDIFISYKETDENGDRTLDSVIAQDIYSELTEKGYRVFFSRITLESKLGTEYEPYIFAALNSAKVMIVVGTDYENFDAVWVKNEWSRFLKLTASGQKKTLIPVFKNMDAYDMPKEFAKLAAQDMGKVGAMQDLVHGVEKLIPRRKSEKTEDQEARPAYAIQSGVNVMAMLKRGQQALEDKEWEVADSFFDQALNIDAECAEAFLGKFCACEKAENLENVLIQRFEHASDNEEIKTKYIPKEIKRIDQIVSAYQVPGYLETEAIQSAMDFFQRQYSGAGDYWLSATEKQKAFISNNRLLSRAQQYASGNIRQQIIDALSTFEHKFQDATNKSIAEEQDAEHRLIKEYEVFLKKQEAEITEKSQRAREKKGQDYQDAVHALELADTLIEWESIRDVFLAFGSFKDARSYAEQCSAKINEWKHKEKELAKKTEIEIKAIHDQFDEMQRQYDKKRLEAEQLRRNVETALTYTSKAEEALKPYEAEYKGLHGLFSSKRRKELESMIARQEKIVKDARQEVDRLQGIYEEAISRIPEKPDEKEMRYAIANKYYHNGLIAKAAQEFYSIREYGDVREIISKDKILSENIDSIVTQLKKNFCTIGNSVYLGQFKQTSGAAGQLEPVEWVVIDHRDNRSLLISRYALDCRPFDDQSTNIWGNCSLRTWLNNEFVETVFDKKEVTALLNTMIDNGTFDVLDRVFLLSSEEVSQYFKSDNARLCKPTPYAKTKNKELYLDESQQYCCWWTRSKATVRDSNCRVTDIHFNGYIGGYNSPFAFGYRVWDDKVGVRPAIWIDLNSEYFEYFK